MRKDGAYEIPSRILTQSQEMLGARGYFYVGGEFVQNGEVREYLHHQMYVEVYVPAKLTQPFPLILFHGGGQTGVNWYGTPDGRHGWLDMFLEMGYAVYVVDVPGSGRSPYHPAVDGPMQHMSADLTKKFFADESGTWPTASRHTQWPAGEERDERGYDSRYLALCAAQSEYLPSPERQRLVQAAGVELLRKTGPAVLVTHSMSGTYGWLIADAAPEDVAAIVALEPSGPPFAGISIISGRQRPYGITDAPLNYEPELRVPDWRTKEILCPPSIEDVQSWLQPEPAGKLANLKDIPVLMITAEASYHAQFDHITAAFLRQAGVELDYIRLDQAWGIRGNGHMMMLEKNNGEIAARIHEWLQARFFRQEVIVEHA